MHPCTHSTSTSWPLYRLHFFSSSKFQASLPQYRLEALILMASSYSSLGNNSLTTSLVWVTLQICLPLQITSLAPAHFLSMFAKTFLYLHSINKLYVVNYSVNTRYTVASLICPFLVGCPSRHTGNADPSLFDRVSDLLPTTTPRIHKVS
jgi:hypothetical protein